MWCAWCVDDLICAVCGVLVISFWCLGASIPKYQDVICTYGVMRAVLFDMWCVMSDEVLMK